MSPLLRALFVRVGEGWRLDAVHAISVADIPSQHRESLLEAIKAFVAEVIREMTPVAALKSKTLILDANVEGPVELEVFGDKERIKQVLVNLIDNAVKYGDHPKPIRIELIDNEPNPEMVMLRVRDSGKGIPAEHLPRLFERFYRVDKDRSRSTPGGTGLGLAICKHIVEAHRSKIQVESTPGEGSVFSFALHKEPFL